MNWIMFMIVLYSKKTLHSYLFFPQLMIVVLASLSHPKSSLSRTDLYSLLSQVLTLTSDLDINIETSIWRDLSNFVTSQLILQYKPPESDANLDKKSLNEKHIFQRVISLLKGIIYQETPATDVRSKKGVRFEPKEKISLSNISQLKKEKKNISEAAEVFLSDVIIASYTLSSLPGPHSSQCFSLFKDVTTLHIPKVAANRLLNGAADGTAQTILCDLGLTDKFPSLPRNKFSSNLLVNTEKVSMDDYFKFLYDHLVGKITDNAVEQTDAVATIFAFVSYCDEAQGAEVLSSILNVSVVTI